MPAYTILLMRRDSTDRRPHTIHIGVGLFWFLVISAFALPILGFLISFGFLAPAWLNLDFKSMQQSVNEAKKNLQPLQQQNADLAARKEVLEKQLQVEREARAKADAEVMMARTARVEAANRMAELEGDVISLKKSLATYEKMLKPKLDRELVQCVNLDANYTSGTVVYHTNFAKIVKSATLPASLNARVRVLTGDNAMVMEQGISNGTVVNHTVDMAHDPQIKGNIPLPPARANGTTRLLDVKIFNGTTPVGYCWKTF